MHKKAIESEMKWKSKSLQNTHAHKPCKCPPIHSKGMRGEKEKINKQKKCVMGRTAYLEMTSGHLSIKYSVTKPERGQGDAVVMATAGVKAQLACLLLKRKGKGPASLFRPLSEL